MWIQTLCARGHLFVTWLILNKFNPVMPKMQIKVKSITYFHDSDI